MNDKAFVASPTPRVAPLLLAALALFLFLLNLGGYDLWPADEPRYAQVAREMLHSGDWLVPRVNGETYLEKPPLLMWCQAALSLPFGDVNEWTARMPSAIAGAATVVITYLLALRLFGAGTAWWSAIILLTMQRFWWQARTGQIDMLLTAFLLGALYALWRWHEERRPGWLVLVYSCMAAGLLAKGPPAAVFILLFIFAFYWRDQPSRRATHWVIGTLAAVAVMLAWYLPARLMAGHAPEEAVQAGIAENIFRNTIGRLFLGVSKAQWPWYYVETIPADILPWTLLLPWALPWFWRNRNASAMHRLLWCWVVPALIFFSMSVGKRAIYILPLFPVFAIIIAGSMSAFLSAARRNKLIVGGLFGGLMMLLGVGVMIGQLVGPPDSPLRGLAAVGGLALAMGLYMLIGLRDNAGVDRIPQRIAVATVALFAIVPLTILPKVNEFKGAANFLSPLRDATAAGEDYRLYSVGFSREEYIYYANHHHEAVLVDLVGRDAIPPADLMTVAKFQRDAKKALGAAMERVHVADWNHLSDAEIVELREAARAGLHDGGLDPQKLAVFEAALQKEVEAFAMAFFAPGDAYLMVQEEDWKWLIALEPRLHEANLVKAEGVGSRRVLLMANF